MIKVYIASPYTIGDVAVNVATNLRMASDLISLGYCPFAPLLSHFQHMMFPQEYEIWLNLDFEWIKVCDCLLRLEGESNGADKEVEYAKSIKLPVFYSLEELRSCLEMI